MTRLLVSVRNCDEARIALAAGVDLVDVKEPRHGALGAAAPATIAEIACFAKGRAPVSCALGELIDFEPGAGRDDLEVDYFKLGLAGCGDLANWPARWREAWKLLPSQSGRIAVAYADWQQAHAPAPTAVIEQALLAGCVGLLIDTFDKHGGSLFAHFSDEALRRLATQARQGGLLLVLAGSLQADDFRRACDLEPDYVGVRGAACRGGRQAPIDARLVGALVAEIRKKAPATSCGR